jgi:hypothetical protein
LINKEMNRLITIFLLSACMLLPLPGQTVPQELVDALKKGDASKMSDHFHQSLEMTILDKDYDASKVQATRIMESFFKNHTPTEFSISFEGTKDQSKYAIGTLKTKDGDFRVNLFFMTKEGARLIYYLSIEKETPYVLSPRP